jgi:hypothetical protein
MADTKIKPLYNCAGIYWKVKEEVKYYESGSEQGWFLSVFLPINNTQEITIKFRATNIKSLIESWKFRNLIKKDKKKAVKVAETTFDWLKNKSIKLQKKIQKEFGDNFN